MGWSQLGLLDPRTGQLLREHLRQNAADIASRKLIAHRARFSTLHLLERADRAGTHIGNLRQAIHQRQGQIGLRGILGVLSLAKPPLKKP